MIVVFLIDQGVDRIADLRQRYSFVGGQLQTPLTRYAIAPGGWAADNGAFAGKAGTNELLRLLESRADRRGDCLFVAVPDVVGSARRTLEVFEAVHLWFPGWPLALVCQDGQEHLPIPWEQIAAVFIGGTDAFKLGPHAAHIIRAAQILGKRTHVGRVNTPDRWAKFAALGVDTCDGTGASRYDWMLDNIAASLEPRPLLCVGE